MKKMHTKISFSEHRVIVIGLTITAILGIYAASTYRNKGGASDLAYNHVAGDNAGLASHGWTPETNRVVIAYSDNVSSSVIQQILKDQNLTQIAILDSSEGGPQHSLIAKTPLNTTALEVVNRIKASKDAFNVRVEPDIAVTPTHFYNPYLANAYSSTPSLTLDLTSPASLRNGSATLTGKGITIGVLLPSYLAADITGNVVKPLVIKPDLTYAQTLTDASNNDFSLYGSQVLHYLSAALPDAIIQPLVASSGLYVGAGFGSQISVLHQAFITQSTSNRKVIIDLYDGHLSSDVKYLPSLFVAPRNHNIPVILSTGNSDAGIAYNKLYSPTAIRTTNLTQNDPLDTMLLVGGNDPFHNTGGNYDLNVTSYANLNSSSGNVKVGGTGWSALQVGVTVAQVSSQYSFSAEQIYGLSCQSSTSPNDYDHSFNSLYANPPNGSDRLMCGRLNKSQILADANLLSRGSLPEYRPASFKPFKLELTNDGVATNGTVSSTIAPRLKIVSTAPNSYYPSPQGVSAYYWYLNGSLYQVTGPAVNYVNLDSRDDLPLYQKSSFPPIKSDAILTGNWSVKQKMLSGELRDIAKINLSDPGLNTSAYSNKLTLTQEPYVVKKSDTSVTIHFQTNKVQVSDPNTPYHYEIDAGSYDPLNGTSGINRYGSATIADITPNASRDQEFTVTGLTPGVSYLLTLTEGSTVYTQTTFALPGGNTINQLNSDQFISFEESTSGVPLSSFPDLASATTAPFWLTNDSKTRAWKTGAGAGGQTVMTRLPSPDYDFHTNWALFNQIGLTKQIDADISFPANTDQNNYQYPMVFWLHATAPDSKTREINGYLAAWDRNANNLIIGVKTKQGFGYTQLANITPSFKPAANIKIHVSFGAQAVTLNGKHVEQLQLSVYKVGEPIPDKPLLTVNDPNNNYAEGYSGFGGNKETPNYYNFGLSSTIHTPLNPGN